LGEGLPSGGVYGELGLEHRALGPIQAIGVDETQHAKGHKYLTLVYQIDAQLSTRAGREFAMDSFEELFHNVRCAQGRACPALLDRLLRKKQGKQKQAPHRRDSSTVVQWGCFGGARTR
jgi:hypothetical protein